MTRTTLAIPGFAGQLIGPDHDEYDQLRAVWNAMHDRRPALIARCATAADVAAAIGYARAAGLVIAVRAGGHSLPGFSTCDGGLVIDLRPMNQVSVDPVTRRATVGGGALLRDLDRATQRHGLVVPAGVISQTGVAGLTLGGGVGRLMRRFGLTIDSLRAAEVVTADGRILRAAADQHPDLFWAIRGGGGNFGVVTEFEFALHELSQLTVLRMYHEMAGAHRVLGRAQQVIAGGAPDAGHTLLTALRDELGPVASELSVVPFSIMQTEGDEFFGPGLLSYVKATFAASLSPDLIDVITAQGQRLGSEVSQIELLSLGGAITRVAPEATAFPHRDAGWLINIPASWRSPQHTAPEIQWVRDTFAAVTPLCSGGAYVNFMDHDEQAGGQVAYGGTLRHLQQVKAAYDPGNVFRLNQNITPAGAA